VWPRLLCNQYFIKETPTSSEPREGRLSQLHRWTSFPDSARTTSRVRYTERILYPVDMRPGVESHAYKGQRCGQTYLTLPLTRRNSLPKQVIRSSTCNRRRTHNQHSRKRAAAHVPQEPAAPTPECVTRHLLTSHRRAAQRGIYAANSVGLCVVGGIVPPFLVLSRLNERGDTT
jgi:hypothetical protein